MTPRAATPPPPPRIARRARRPRRAAPRRVSGPARAGRAAAPAPPAAARRAALRVSARPRAARRTPARPPDPRARCGSPIVGVAADRHRLHAGLAAQAQRRHRRNVERPTSSATGELRATGQARDRRAHPGRRRHVRHGDAGARPGEVPQGEAEVVPVIERRIGLLFLAFCALPCPRRAAGAAAGRTQGAFRCARKPTRSRSRRSRCPTRRARSPTAEASSSRYPSLRRRRRHAIPDQGPGRAAAASRRCCTSPRTTCCVRSPSATPASSTSCASCRPARPSRSPAHMPGIQLIPSTRRIYPQS